MKTRFILTALALLSFHASAQLLDTRGPIVGTLNNTFTYHAPAQRFHTSSSGDLVIRNIQFNLNLSVESGLSYDPFTLAPTLKVGIYHHSTNYPGAYPNYPGEYGDPSPLGEIFTPLIAGYHQYDLWGNIPLEPDTDYWAVFSAWSFANPTIFTFSLDLSASGTGVGDWYYPNDIQSLWGVADSGGPGFGVFFPSPSPISMVISVPEPNVTGLLGLASILVVYNRSALRRKNR